MDNGGEQEPLRKCREKVENGEEALLKAHAPRSPVTHNLIV